MGYRERAQCGNPNRGDLAELLEFMGFHVCRFEEQPSTPKSDADCGGCMDCGDGRMAAKFGRVLARARPASVRR